MFQRRGIGTSHSPKPWVPSLTGEAEAGNKKDEKESNNSKENKILRRAASPVPPLSRPGNSSVQLAVNANTTLDRKGPLYLLQTLQEKPEFAPLLVKSGTSAPWVWP
jgi:hypothetical protein